MALPVLRRLGFQLEISFDLRDARVRRVLRLMLPVTIGLGLINFNVLINSTLGALVSEERAARDRRRVPHLHAAAGHVQRRDRDRAVPGAQPLRRAPRLRRPARADWRNGMRQIFLLLVPAAAATIALSEPITRLIYQHGRFGHELDRAGLDARCSGSPSACRSAGSTCCSRAPSSPPEAVDHHRLAGLNLVVNVARLGRALQAVRHRRHRHRHGRLERGDDARADVLPAPRAARPPRGPPHARSRRRRSLAAALLGGRRLRDAGTLLDQALGVGCWRSCSRWASPCRRGSWSTYRGPPAAAYRRRARSSLRPGTARIARRTVGIAAERHPDLKSAPRTPIQFRMRLTSALWAWRSTALPTPPRRRRRWSTTSPASNGCCRRSNWRAAGACAARRCAATGRPATGCRARRASWGARTATATEVVVPDVSASATTWRPTPASSPRSASRSSPAGRPSACSTSSRASRCATATSSTCASAPGPRRAHRGARRPARASPRPSACCATSPTSPALEDADAVAARLLERRARPRPAGLRAARAHDGATGAAAVVRGRPARAGPARRRARVDRDLGRRTGPRASPSASPTRRPRPASPSCAPPGSRRWSRSGSSSQGELLGRPRPGLRPSRPPSSTDEVELLELLATHGGRVPAHRRAVAELRERAATDPLTGLGHHATFHEALAGIAPPADHRRRVCDIDGFKHLNDTYGHGRRPRAAAASRTP